MTSLGEVYGAQSRGMVDPRYIQAGMGLFLGGVGLALVSLLLATTGLGSIVGLDTYGAREVAGVLGGIGVIMVLLGTMAMFPATPRAKATAIIGATLAILGVGLFWHAYPHDWAGVGNDLTPLVSGVYAFGVILMSWTLVTTVATFKQRNAPGGTVELHLAPSTGQPRLLDAARAGLLAAGRASMDLFSADQPETSSSTQSPPVDVGRTDGGDAEVLEPPRKPRQPADRYCGNCVHFTYATENNRMVPYCRHHEEAMDDVEPCSQWEANSG